MPGVKRGKRRKAALPRRFKPYLSLSGAKSQGMKQLMAGGGVALIGVVLVPLLSGLFG